MKLIAAVTVSLLTVSACASVRPAAAPHQAKPSRTATSAASATHRPSPKATSKAPSRARSNRRTHRPKPVTSSPAHRPSPVLTSYPRVNRPCKGQIPEPFAGIATSGDFGAKVAGFRRYAGSHLRLVEFYNRFPGPFQSSAAQQVVNMHELPLIQLDPRQISLAKLAAGAYDSSIRSYAREVKAFGCHVVLSFGHEMNGWWYPWGLPGTTPRAFKAAWRHFFGIFAAEHVTNVIRSWDPSHEHVHYRSGKVAWPASMWFPGNKYIDWVGIDGYLTPGHSFDNVLRFQLRNIRRVTHKPIYLAETGVADSAIQARQIAGLFKGIWRWHLAGLVWFDQDRRAAWSLGGKPRKDAAFRRAVARFP
jgi:mannan endo-1,4-beta-mannosidase